MNGGQTFATFLETLLLITVPSWAEALASSTAALGPFFDGVARQLVYATLVALVVALPAHLCEKRWPSLANALWCLVPIRLLLPLDWTTGLSLRRALDFDSLTPLTSLTTAPLGAPAEAGSWLSPWVETAPSMAISADTVSIPWQLVLLLTLWFLGSTLFFAQGWWRRRHYMGLLRRQVTEPRILHRLESWRQSLGVKRQVGLWTGDAAQTPFTLGWLRPRIFIPQSLLTTARTPDGVSGDSSTGEIWDAVLGHEMAHIAHGDDLWLRFERLLLSLYFFFPPLWFACRRMHDARERLADARAVTGQILPPKTYALALLRVHQMQLLRSRAASAFGLNPRRLVLRIQSILDLPQSADSKTRNPSFSWRRLALRPVAGLPFALLVGLFVLPMAASEDAAPAAAVQVTEEAAVPEEVLGGSPLLDPPTISTSSVTADGIALLHPLEGAKVTAPFGLWKSPFKLTKDHHNGLDLASPVGSTIVAPAQGVVTVVQSDLAKIGDYGILVQIDHGHGVDTVYAHLGEVLVRTGEKVEAGQPIAKVGMTGKTTGPHLHFEVLKDGQYLDPKGVIQDDC